MKSINITSELEVYDNLEELPQDVFDLMQKAFDARDNAYAPYSQFNVGAAILLENAKVVTGSNQENASYPSGLCAERTAFFYAGAKYPGVRMKKVAISAKSLKHAVAAPVSPCGACRQVMAEYEVNQEENIELYFMGETGKVLKVKSVKDLLPLIFDRNIL
ncbi:cytidine deaminase [Autumnicola psychrophila]|uniref:Cytidine deaminase n=1 Tax=Autumnicola psychrophila TaxID=3075592 RepID=A0ABU3DRJ6_9FLAO|nr:cytidine deaminase [Zunongwangia sp. F225]MDT0686329.1 cytidine deaminase [Zunongwangia sp. F225]